MGYSNSKLLRASNKANLRATIRKIFSYMVRHSEPSILSSNLDPFLLVHCVNSRGEIMRSQFLSDLTSCHFKIVSQIEVDFDWDSL